MNGCSRSYLVGLATNPVNERVCARNKLLVELASSHQPARL